MSAATRVRRLIERKGGTATLGTTGGQTYNPATDTFTGGAATSASVPAIETRGDADRFAALGLTLSNPVTLIIAAEAIGFAPQPGMALGWAGLTYTIRDVEPTSLDGGPIMWKVTGSL
jgi:hypothetical protein